MQAYMILFYACLCFTLLTIVLLFNVKPARLSDGSVSSVETALPAEKNCFELVDESSEQ